MGRGRGAVEAVAGAEDVAPGDLGEGGGEGEEEEEGEEVDGGDHDGDCVWWI